MIVEQFGYGHGCYAGLYLRELTIVKHYPC